MLDIQIASAGAGILAAALWLCSATGAAPPSSYEGSERLKAFLDRAGRFNKWAAGVTALSVGLQAVATILTAAGWR